MNIDPLALLNSFQQQFFQQIAQIGNVLWSYGFTLLGAITIIMTVFAGIRVMNGDHGHFHKLRNFAGVVLLLWIIMQAYTRPTALLGGDSFSQMIPNYAAGLAAHVDSTTESTLVNTLNQYINDVQSNNVSYSIWKIQPLITTVMTIAIVALLELAMFLVIAFGYLALGVVIGVGPILIPFLLVPKLDFLFWGWLKALIKYSFYPVVGKLFLLIICQLITTLIASLSNGPGGFLALTFAGNFILSVFLLVGIYGIFKIPSLITDIFNGASSAGDATAAAQQGVRTAISLAV
ncbi:MAG TPA: type IV secretion system protein [Candidatus Angelobacter sp.]|nr:type IV secretion system protein [Candidatus Angelobacter sp.]